MLIDEIARAVVEILYIRRVGKCIGRVLRTVEPLRIEPFPPLPLAVREGEAAVIGYPGERAGPVGAVRDLEPPPVPRLVNGHAELHAAIARGLRPCSDHIAAGADVLRVPRVVRRVPRVETVVMVRQRHEQPRTRAAVNVHQLIGLPIQQRPLRAEFLVPEPGRVPVMLSEVPVLRLVIDIDIPPEPVAVLRNALWAPVIPDAELRVAVPFRAFVL